MSTTNEDVFVNRLRSTLLQLKMMSQNKGKSPFHLAAPIGIALPLNIEYKSKRKLDRDRGKNIENRQNIESDLKYELAKRIKFTFQSKSKKYTGLQINRAVMHHGRNKINSQRCSELGDISNRDYNRQNSKRKILSTRRDNHGIDNEIKFEHCHVKTQTSRDVNQRPCTAYTQQYKYHLPAKHKLNSMEMRFKTERSKCMDNNVLEGWKVQYQDDDF